VKEFLSRVRHSSAGCGVAELCAAYIAQQGAKRRSSAGCGVAQQGARISSVGSASGSNNAVLSSNFSSESAPQWEAMKKTKSGPDWNTLN
jgi:hypothetical protein